MKIVIAGAGSVGRSVALELLAHGHDITLIDHTPEKLRISSVADADWVLADACSPDALRDAGVAEDVSVSTPRIMTSLVEEAVSVGVPVRLFSFNTAAVSMHALILPEDSPVVGRRVYSLELPANAVLAALLRDGRPMNPSADDVFEASDELLLLVPDADSEGLVRLRQAVASPTSEDSEESEGESAGA